MNKELRAFISHKTFHGKLRLMEYLRDTKLDQLNLDRDIQEKSYSMEPNLHSVCVAVSERGDWLQPSMTHCYLDGPMPKYAFAYS